MKRWNRIDFILFFVISGTFCFPWLRLEVTNWAYVIPISFVVAFLGVLLVRWADGEE